MLDSIACLLVKSLGAFLCLLPPRLAIGLGARLGRLAYWLQPKRSRIGIANLQAAFEGNLTRTEASRTIKRCYQHLGEGVFELLRLPVMDRAYFDRYVQVEHLDRLEAATASGRPVIVLTGHFGSWEMCSIGAAVHGYPVVALARAQKKMPKLYQLLISYRESKGCTIVHKGGAMRRLIAALENRELVGIVADQASRQGIFIPFFGRPALFATGPFALAYSRNALLLPVFIHRTSGPYHRFVIEPIYELSQAEAQEEAVRQGIERFTNLLAKHIAQDPSQWLWMHKRWKHTPARRVLILSDGKAGHVKQSLALTGLLRRQNSSITHQTVEVRYRNGFLRAVALLWSAVMPSGWAAQAIARLCLTEKSAHALFARSGDIFISCGSSTAPVALLWSGLNKAKSVAIMKPSPFLISRFDLVIAPVHDGLVEQGNIVNVPGALAEPLESNRMKESIEHLKQHPRFRSGLTSAGQSPVISVLIGGETDDFILPPAWAEALAKQIESACHQEPAVCAVTTSRRTPKSAEQILKNNLENNPRCRLLLLASRDQLDGTMEGLLALARVVVVTGESISMVSEACASGRRVVAVKLPQRKQSRPEQTKHEKFLHHLQAEGYLEIAPVNEVASAIHRALSDATVPKQLEPTPQLHQALSALLK